MIITLSPETQKLLEQQLKKSPHANPDALVRYALETLGHIEAEAFEDLDPDTRAAIERAEAQSQRGEARPWKAVKEELRQRFLQS
jgi:hypothetical protein